MTGPLISIIVVAYNCEKYVIKALDSILSQDLDSLELIVINNASTDKTGEILRNCRDPRLILIENPVNEGPQAANLGLPAARGKYIARLDADDIALPGRLRAQYDYMEAHPEIALCGSEYEMIHEDGSVFSRSHSLYDPFEIRWKLGWANFIGHSTIMMRKPVMEKLGGYNSSLWCCEDYDLLSRISWDHKMAVLPKILVQYRVYSNSISHTRREEMAKNYRDVSFQHLQHILGKNLSSQVGETAVDIMRMHACRTPDQVSEALALIVDYTRICVRESPTQQGNSIRNFTAKHLVQYGRRFAKDGFFPRYPFERAAIKLDPGQLVKRGLALVVGGSPRPT